MNNFTIFISDLHLSPANQGLINLFSKFSENIAPEAEIYILGDFFKFWAGDDDCSAFSEQIKAILKKTTTKVPVYLMPGNRDFILGQTFAKETGCILITDPHKINLYGKPTLLTHGDSLCTKDTTHRIFHTIIRFPYGIKYFLKLPFKIRLSLASIMQKYTSKIKILKNKSNMLPQENTIRDLLIEYNSEQIIHGHTHHIGVKNSTINGQTIRRISLGAWNDKVGTILIYYQNGQYKFKDIC